MRNIIVIMIRLHHLLIIRTITQVNKFRKNRMLLIFINCSPTRGRAVRAIELFRYHPVHTQDSFLRGHHHLPDTGERSEIDGKKTLVTDFVADRFSSGFLKSFREIPKNSSN